MESAARRPPDRTRRSTTGLVGARGRSILKTSVWSLAAKCVTAANLLLSVPFVLPCLGPEQFGAWATLVSFTVLAGFLDFGFGNGAMNLVAAAHGRGTHEEIATIYHEGRRTLTTVSLWLALATVIALAFAPWQRILGLPATMATDSRAAAAAALFTITIGVPLNLANRVQLGLGRGDRTFRWQVAGQLLALALVVILARTHASMTILTLAAVATPLLASVGNTLQLSHDFDRPAMRVEARHDIAARIQREGTLFFVLQLAAALAFSADLPLISALRGALDAGHYAIVQRMFSVVPLGLSLVWMPLWPVYRQALAARDHNWVVRTLRRSIALAIVAAGCGALTIVLGFDHIIRLWMHRPLAVAAALPAGFAVWCVLEATGSAISAFLNAASIMRYQVITASTFAMVCIAAKAWVVVHFGITALPWITSATYFLASLLPTMIYGRRLVATALSKDY